MNVLESLKNNNIMNFIGLFILSLLIFLIMSCDESLNSDIEEKDMIPLAVGNYWIFSSWEKDQNNNIITDTKGEDSIVIEKKEKINSLDAFLLVKYRDGLVIDTLILAKFKNVLYKLDDSTDTFIPGLESTWFPIVDLTSKLSNRWNVFNTVLYDFPFLHESKEYLATYNHTINGTFEKADSIDINSKKVLIKRFSNYYDSRLRFEISNKKYNDDGSYYYEILDYIQFLKYYDIYELAENIGIFSIQRPSFYKNYFTNPSSTISGNKHYNGRESNLLRYYIQNF